MATLSPLAPSGGTSLELVQNLTLVLSASSQSRDEELGKVFSTFQALLQEVKEDLAANAKEIAALKTNVATLESEKEQSALAMAAEKIAFESLQKELRNNANTITSLAGTVNALQSQVNVAPPAPPPAESLILDPNIPVWALSAMCIAGVYK